MSNDARFFADSLTAHQHLLRERLHFLLSPLSPVLRVDVEAALAEKGKLLSHTEKLLPSRPTGMWPLLTLLVAQHIRPVIDLERALAVALAVECYVCALDLLDDVEDDDQTPIVQSLGTARVLNISTALLALSMQAICSLRKQRASHAVIARLLETLQASMLEAAAGQHRDLLAEQQPVRELTREECIDIAAGKAGGVMRAAFLLGAVCAGAGKRELRQLAALGTALGIAHQLDNDAHDLYYLLQRESSRDITSETVRASVKSDLARGKKTLPVVLAAQSLAEKRGIGDTQLDRALKNLSELSDKEREEYQRVLHEGIIATWGISLLYRERAHERLQEIEARRPVAFELRLLLGFEPSPGET
ncbi:MAG TPA: polyprenyl synthetase family protein [Ktedonobacteraceae bacterium]|nr:polyprenyl synthetase family protein [Ktedonobacteraceae bacterium]